MEHLAMSASMVAPADSASHAIAAAASDDLQDALTQILGRRGRPVLYGAILYDLIGIPPGDSWEYWPQIWEEISGRFAEMS